MKYVITDKAIYNTAQYAIKGIEKSRNYFGNPEEFVQDAEAAELMERLNLLEEVIRTFGRRNVPDSVSLEYTEYEYE